MERNCALKVTLQALQAIESLSEILTVTEGQVNDSEHERLKGAVAVILTRVQCDILEPIHKQHPDLDGAS